MRLRGEKIVDIQQSLEEGLTQLSSAPKAI